MRKSKKIILFIIIFTLPFLSLSTVYGANIFKNVCNSSTASTSTVCQDASNQAASNSNTFISVLKNIINLLSFITGVAAVIMLVISGLRMVISAGDANTVKEARGGIIGAVVGILIVVLAQAIVIFVLNKIK